ncbi:MAG: hypothetical protein L3J78_03535, partial [Thermoplasmata archaeon]|nr:hypothetical protein [Thermoplasmata archaeon]
ALTMDPRVTGNPSVVLDPFARVEFAKDSIVAGTRGLHLSAGLYTRPMVVDEIGERLRATADRDIPRIPSEPAYVTVLRGPGSLRILGTGRVSG